MDVPTTLRLFYQKDAPNCAPVAADQRNRANSTFDGLQVFTEPGPFSMTSTLTFSEGGNYRFCAYLENGQAIGHSAAHRARRGRARRRVARRFRATCRTCAA